MFFFHGRDLSEESLYVDLIDKMGLSSDVFLDEFHSERAHEAVADSFKRAANISKDFPTLYFRTENSLELLGDRFSEYDKIKTNCANMIAKNEWVLFYVKNICCWWSNFCRKMFTFVEK